MTEYHVKCGIFGIYAGTLKKNGNEWLNKNETTNECVSATAQYLLENNKSFSFNYNGKKYKLSVKEVEK